MPLNHGDGRNWLNNQGVFPNTAWAAANLAMGTRYGEQLT